MKTPKVIIIGGGFAGLNAALALKNADVDLLVIDKANHHLFQPLLYQIATAALSPGDIATPIREILAKQLNTTVLLADIVSVDKQNKEVVAGNGDRFSYDYLVIAVGANHSYFGNPQWEQHAPGLKTIYDAITIRERILLSYERAERSFCHVEAQKYMRFVIVGGGPTGVEMAGAIGEIAHKAIVSNFRHINTWQTKIYLIEGLDQILPSFPRSLAEKAKRDLEQMGVEVLLNTRVTNVTENGVWLGDRFLESSNVIWAAGNEAAPLLQSLEMPLDKFKRAIVNSDLSLPGYPEVFVIGDAACNYDRQGKPLAAVAPVAIQQGKYVAKVIAERIPAEKRKSFKYRDKGMMATVGRAKAVAVMGKLKISGFLAWLAWCFIHIAYLITFASKALVLMQWFYLYLSNQRRIRLITHPVSEEEMKWNL